MKNTTQQIRQNFLAFFTQYGHTYLPSSPLIPKDDKSLMFVNAGMVPFKNFFTGKENSDFKRITTCQKCLRAGGKHNDLDNVGYTSRHHTMFEMLGNFSFGDYFKEEAIYYAWNLLTQVFQIDKTKLLVTVHESDNESATLWRKIASLSEDKIIKINTEDNFWSMGTTGPCGPCTEIFFDHGPSISGGIPGSTTEGDRYTEIWNIVFMQFEKLECGKMVELQQKSIDTGMGLERIAAVLQGVHDNYQSDILANLIDHTKKILKVPINRENLCSYKTLADHTRAASFLIADGVIPSNEGSGYVLRRIIRRAVRHTNLIMGEFFPVLFQNVPKLIELMSEYYPELQRAEKLIYDTVKYEEEKFGITLSRGLKLLDKMISKIKEGEIFSGECAFELYDTYGFPLDLTDDILKNKGIKIDVEKFTALMKQQKIQSRDKAEWKNTNSSWDNITSSIKKTHFCNTTEDLNANILSIVYNDIAVERFTTTEEKFLLFTDKTNFYAEAGGQKGDIGHIATKSAFLEVIDTKKILGKFHAHVCILKQGNIQTGEQVTLCINKDNRQKLCIHHSATHILLATLQKYVSENIIQKGSLVENCRLRLDINFNDTLSYKQICEIERHMQNIILQNVSVTSENMLLEEALKQNSTATFGEKYGKEVRVISMENADQCFSKELCGGTHVSKTGEIGMIKIVSQTSIAAGIKRLEAVAGTAALSDYQQSNLIISNLIEELSCSKDDIVQNTKSLKQQVKTLKEECAKTKIAMHTVTRQEVEKSSDKIKGVSLIFKDIKKESLIIARKSADRTAKHASNAVIIFTCQDAEKKCFSIAVTEDIIDTLTADKVAKILTKIINGNGGGNKKMAQCGTLNLNISNQEILDQLKQNLLSI
ncbi:alanine--tRNA ligase [Candidatus Sneabacter namystus]|uniref:Alanine--tRNA ligase n=1 Tax=Candidatus Sneabacter namystus TaxID=2601646 RepID=A0A5C0UI47_9RICK|nr:alanine--tRNA ligase [Candidatus Sneabacter namystus]QEK39439.1 alanine--tRNA ligase [Candidatus Sneabacter namystus]